jgi:hypothetical protein
MAIISTLFYAIPFIAIFDWIVFQKWTMCENCGHKLNKWYNYLLPTALEVLLFYAGIILGKGL